MYAKDVAHLNVMHVVAETVLLVLYAQFNSVLYHGLHRQQVRDGVGDDKEVEVNEDMEVSEWVLD